MNNIIHKVEIKKLWNIYNVKWESIAPDVNIIVGINGSGKSTILNAIYTCLNRPEEIKDNFFLDYITVHIGNYVIDSRNGKPADMPIPLSAKLNREDTSFDPIIMRLKNLIATEPVSAYKELTEFSKIINSLFHNTKKRLDEHDLSDIKFLDVNNQEVSLQRLSLGEKQMLTFLYKVFLTRKKPYALFLDEPEYSLHIEWQEKLIDIIRQINPNCQLFITTHSPNIFSNGWQDKLQFIEDFTTEI